MCARKSESGKIRTPVGLGARLGQRPWYETTTTTTQHHPTPPSTPVQRLLRIDILQAFFQHEKPLQ